MGDVILRGEVWCRLSLIEKRYLELFNLKFSSDVTYSLIGFIIKLLKLVKKRFSVLDDNHIKHISNFCSVISGLYQYIHGSNIKNVPWSIIPSLEDLFNKITKECNFIITPIWEDNYGIDNQNIIEVLRNKFLCIPNLVFNFEDTEKFNSLLEDFLRPYKTSIYIILFSKLERNSPIHFALLGHEIGHIYSERWNIDKFDDFLAVSNLISSYENIAIQILEKEKGIKYKKSDNLFNDHQINTVVSFKLEVVRKIMNESVSDIFGAFVFGDSALIATYMFAIKLSMDSLDEVDDGYLCWRWRLKIIFDCIEYIRSKNELIYKAENGWNDRIKKELDICLSGVCKKCNKNDYLRTFFKSYDIHKNDIYTYLFDHIGDQIYTKFINKNDVNEVIERLKNNITPNSSSSIKDQFQEIPIDIRNIIYGTWLYFDESINKKGIDEATYEKITNVINKLSLKGIELSKEQERFNNDFIKR